MGMHGKKHSLASREKMRLAHLGKPSNRKGKKASLETLNKMRLVNLGKKHSKETKLKMSISAKKVEHTREWNKRVGLAIRGQNNGQWKGDNVGYAALHDWVKYYLGTPSFCESCGSVSSKRYDWANKSFQYKRDLSDWIRLCRSCHIRKDKKDKTPRRLQFT